MLFEEAASRTFTTRTDTQGPIFKGQGKAVFVFITLFLVAVVVFESEPSRAFDISGESVGFGRRFGRRQTRVVGLASRGRVIESRIGRRLHVAMTVDMLEAGGTQGSHGAAAAALLIGLARRARGVQYEAVVSQEAVHRVAVEGVEVTLGQVATHVLAVVLVMSHANGLEKAQTATF